MNLLRVVVPGLILGFVVARLGFGDFDELHQMLVFRDLRLLFAFALAACLSIAAFAALRVSPTPFLIAPKAFWLSVAALRIRVPGTPVFPPSTVLAPSFAALTVPIPATICPKNAHNTTPIISGS